MARTGPYRVAQGGLIDRTREISFRFNSKSYVGHPGDSLASALLANGVRVVARSFKFHRPRGIFACGVEEPHGLLTLGRGGRSIPSARAPLIELTAGLEAHSQSGWPALGFDVGRALDAFAPLWAAGFYNKTFKWPRWHTYEPIIRRLAGLGKAPRERDPDRYEIGNFHCDVLVIGAGISGLTAALEAAQAGARVLVVEQGLELGGQAGWNGAPARTAPSRSAAELVAEFSALPEVKLLTRTTAVGYYDHDVVGLVEQPGNSSAVRERYWIVRAGCVVLATGMIEQPLIFDHNDRPGIMLAQAARQYLSRYGVALGRRVVIATNNDSVYELARELRQAGVTVVAVVDSRTQVPERNLSAMRGLSIEVMTGSLPMDSAGFSALRQVTVGHLSPDGGAVTARRRLACDALAVSGGFTPTLHLFAQAGGKLSFDEASGALRPVAAHPSIQIVGAAAESVPTGPRVSPIGSTRRQWVDLLHDVTVADLELALRENYTSVEHVKRYTTVGMAPDQGKTSIAGSLDVLGRLRGIPTANLGHTTQRPPFMPVTLGAIAGREIGERFAPRRLLPQHTWHTAHGGLLQDFGGWQRPVAYVRAGETRAQATERECRAARNAAVLFDGSSLGKIELQGPDALEFIDRFYINYLMALQPGRVRYGLMLRESGVLFDDGTVAVLAPDHVLITTTSGNASRVHAWLEEWHQCEWPHLRVAITPVTEQWATLSLAGPRARQILSKLKSDIALAPSSFPHLMTREGHLQGVPCRMCRVSFTGELTYEINVPAGQGADLWEALMALGAPEGIEPLGMDSLLRLRVEKGFLHLGTDTDGTTVPDDVGWGKIASAKRADFIGARSLSLPEHVRPDRLQLVGLRGEAADDLIIGSHLRLNSTRHPTDGWITSAARSVLTGEPIGMAMLRDGRRHMGAMVTVHDADRVVRAKVVALPFYDPSGERMHG